MRTLDDARSAARRLKALGPGAVIIKGGHLEGPQAIDILFDGINLVELRGPRIATTSTHGTGCTFASAIAANLALGLDLREATWFCPCASTLLPRTHASSNPSSDSAAAAPISHFSNRRTAASIPRLRRAGKWCSPVPPSAQAATPGTSPMARPCTGS